MSIENEHDWTRADVIALVKAVVGEVKVIAPTFALRAYRGARRLKLTFVLEGRGILGTWSVPIPDTMIAVIDDEDRNPYNVVDIRIELSNDMDAGSMKADGPSRTENVVGSRDPGEPGQEGVLDCGGNSPMTILCSWGAEAELGYDDARSWCCAEAVAIFHGNSFCAEHLKAWVSAGKNRSHLEKLRRTLNL